MRMETLGFDHGLTDQAETTLIFTFEGASLSRWRGADGSRKNKNLAVSENTIYIEKQEPDVLSSRLSRLCFEHGGDSSTRPHTNWPGATVQSAKNLPQRLKPSLS